MNTKSINEIEAATPFLLSRAAVPAAPYLAPHLKRAFGCVQILENGESVSVQALAASLRCNAQTINQTLQALKRGGYKLEKKENQWQQIIRVCVPKDGTEYILEYAGTYQLSHLLPPSSAYRFIPRTQGVPLEFGVPGIYCIKNIRTQKLYVGQAKDIRTRWTNHVSIMRTGKKANSKLRLDWEQSEYTDWVFIFQQYALKDRQRLEQDWMRRFSSESLYNVANGVLISHLESIQ